MQEERRRAMTFHNKANAAVDREIRYASNDRLSPKN